MRIDGICVCVGPLYAGYMAKALPVWLRTLDSVTVATDFDTIASLPATNKALQFVMRPPTYTVGVFNKGGMLNAALLYEATSNHPTDWILSFDADILPPDNWRETIEPLLQPGNLYGARRQQPDGKRRDKGQWWPKGFFQLWHASDPTYRRSPVFAEHFVDAGGYDREFANQWLADKQIQLPITVTHLGERSMWCGPETTLEQQRGAVQRFRERQRAG